MLGLSNGRVLGISKSPTAASFVRPSRPADPPRSFLEAVNAKYAGEYTLPDGRRAAEEIIFFGKRAEEVGFEKIRRKQANVGELKVVIVEDLQVLTALADDEDEGTITRTCPKITQLGLGRNLFDRLGPVMDICRELPALNSLNLGYVPLALPQTTPRLLTSAQWQPVPGSFGRQLRRGIRWCQGAGS